MAPFSWLAHSAGTIQHTFPFSRAPMEEGHGTGYQMTGWAVMALANWVIAVLLQLVKALDVLHYASKPSLTYLDCDPEDDECDPGEGDGGDGDPVGLGAQPTLLQIGQA